MKKTIPTSIANTLFYIEEDTYSKLEDYLASIREHFAGNADSIEIIHDIEDRIREQFTEATGTERIITKEHVDELIARMGKPEDFGDESNSESAHTEKGTHSDKHSRKLYRDTNHAVIAGVASGIGAYLGIDPVVIRIVFLISMFLGGSGFIAYIILWAAVPEAKTSAQKLEMQGDPVNLQSMKEKVNEKVNEVKENKKLHGIFAKIVGAIGPVLGGIVGVGLKLISIFAYIGITCAFIIALFQPANSMLPLEITSIVSLPMFYIALSALYIVSIIPFIFISTLGRILLRKKPFFHGKRATALFVIWIALIIGSVAIGASVGSRVENHIRTSPQYSETTKVIPLTAFDTLTAENGQHITIVAGAEYSATIHGRTADVERIVFDQTGIAGASTTLLVHNSNDEWRACFFCRHMTSRIEITVPADKPLKEITSQNATSIKYTGAFTDLKVSLQNASVLELSGTAKSLTATLENASALQASALKADTVSITMQNATKADFYAITKLNFEAKNASKGTQFGPASIDGAKTDNASKIEIASERAD